MLMPLAETYRRRSHPENWTPFDVVVSPNGDALDPAQLDEGGRRMLAILRSFGSWLMGQRWYLDELLAPAPAPWVVGMRGYPSSIRRLPATVSCRYLSSPLEAILGSSPLSYGAFVGRVVRATQCVVELRVDVDGGRPVCREVRILPAEAPGELTRTPNVPLDDLVGRYIRTWYAVSGIPRPIQRRAFTPAILQAVALVYRANPKRPAQAVAEHFGWRSPRKSWAADLIGRARASRAIGAAREEGYLRKAPGERQKGEIPD
jgi:hypothetical protein